MPDVNRPPQDHLYAVLSSYDKRLKALETQQSFLVADVEQNQRVRLGPLVDPTSGEPNGAYGLSVSDPSGLTTNVLPVATAPVPATESTSSTTYTNLTTPGPLVTAYTGASGDFEVIANSYIGIPGATSGQSGGFVGVSVNGAAPTGELDEILYFANTGNGTAQGQASNQSCTAILQGLTPLTSYTFEMVYKMDGPGTVAFGSRYLSVRPL